MAVRIVTDSTSDLTPDQAREHGVTVVPLNVHFGEEVFRDQVDLTPATFFEKLAHSKELPKTSQPSPGQFEEAYRRLAAEADEIVSIHISTKLSQTLNSAMVAAKALQGKPHVEFVDSRTACVGLGLLAIEAARLAREGKPAAEVAELVRAMIPRSRLVFFVDTLEYLQRGGRIGKAQAFIGSFLNVKPMLTVKDGEVHPLERLRTRQKAVERLASLIEEAPPLEWVAILHDGHGDDVELLARHASRRVQPDHLLISPYGPVIGTHVGPGGLGIAMITAA